MNNHHDDEDAQFKMRLDEEADTEEAVIPTQVDELRIEKLNQRVTLISILIPVLIVVILGVAYLDIKRRVIRTEDTGAETAQHLSEDLESRFSTLSLNQAHLGESLAKLQDQTNQSLAKAQVNLQKLDEGIKQSRETMVSQKEMKSVSQKMDQGMANVARSVEDLKAQIDTLSQSLQSRLEQFDRQVAEQNTKLTEFKGTISDLEQNKMDKNALDLAVKLEALKIKQAFNVQWEDIQAQLQSLEQKMNRLASARATSSPTVPPQKPAVPPSAPAPQVPGKLQEQTIGK